MGIINKQHNCQVKELSDEILMEKVITGNLDFMKSLYERYANQILNYFFRLTRNYEDSQDLVQNVFLRIMQYRKAFNQNRIFKSWIFQIARNVFNNYYTGKKETIRNVENFDEQSFEYDEGLKQVNDDETLFRSISKLPKDYQELIVLSKFNKLKYKEIAEIYETTEASVKNKLYRAMDNLRVLYLKNE
jgi:RNA polymerase sigma factor (sigma-70 family)